MAIEAQRVPLASRWRLHLGWGIGTLGASLLLNTFAALQAYYLTNVLHISAGMAGVVLMVAKYWDWVANPAMGAISDGTRSRWGRRRPYLVLGGVVTGAALALYFASALTPLATSLWFIALALMLVGTGYTIFNVPYMAMPVEMIDDYDERTRMFRYRVFFIAIGTLLGVGAAQRISEMFGGGPVGYARMGLVYGAAICLFMVLSFFGTAGAPSTGRSAVRLSFSEQLRTGLQNAPFAALLGTKFTQLFGLFTSNAMLVYVIANVLGKERPGQWMLYFTLAGAAGQIASIPLWNAIAQRIEKRRTYVLATMIYCGMSLTWLLATPAEPLWFFCLRGLLKGCAASGLLLMGQSMLPDTIEYDQRRTGLHRAGIFSGLYSMVEKVAATFAPSILLFTYAWFGFESKAPSQSAASVEGIRLAAGLLPCLYFLASFVPLHFYRLTARELTSAQRIA